MGEDKLSEIMLCDLSGKKYGRIADIKSISDISISDENYNESIKNLKQPHEINFDICEEQASILYEIVKRQVESVKSKFEIEVDKSLKYICRKYRINTNIKSECERICVCYNGNLTWFVIELDGKPVFPE